jgi:hypothetical protein
MHFDPLVWSLLTEPIKNLAPFKVEDLRKY